MGAALERHVKVRLALVTGVSLAIGFGVHWSVSKTIQNSHELEQSHAILEGLQDLLLLIRDAESGQRGYLLAGKESYLYPYDRAVRLVGLKLDFLRNLTANDPKMSANLRQVEHLVNGKLGEMRETIGLFKKLEKDEALRLIKTDRGQHFMIDIRRLVGKIIREEKTRLAQGNQWAAAWSSLVLSSFWIGIIVNSFILLVVYRVVATEMANRRAAELALKQSEAQLRGLNAELETQKSRLARVNLDLFDLAAKDGLTGLVNRRFMDNALVTIHSRAVLENLPLTLLFIDVDHFKLYNDDFGHAMGDEALKALAIVLRQCVRDCDLIGRYGGEEFVIVLPGLDAEGGIATAQRLRLAIERSKWPGRSVTASVGVATLNAKDHDVAALVASADMALYASKQSGRNRVTHARDLAPRPQIADLSSSLERHWPAPRSSSVA